MSNPKQLRAWREAHPDLVVPEAGLETMAPFASLYAVDMITYLEVKNVDPAVADFLRALLRELVWAYGGWAKAQDQANPAHLIEDMLNNCSGPGVEGFYAPIQKFITDYAAANGIVVKAPGVKPQAWEAALERGGLTPPDASAPLGRIDGDAVLVRGTVPAKEGDNAAAA